MKEKNEMLLPILLVVLIILVTIVAFMYKKQYEDLKRQTLVNEELIIKFDEKLSKEEGLEIYNKATLGGKETFIQQLLMYDYDISNGFNDKHILTLLTAIDSYNERKTVFNIPQACTSESKEGCWGEGAKFDDVQLLAQKYFEKELDKNNFNINEEGIVVAPEPTGFGILKAEFTEAYKSDNNIYLLKFKTTNSEETETNTYTLVIKYDEKTNTLVYKSLKSN